jgi:hypothetical protein
MEPRDRSGTTARYPEVSAIPLYQRLMGDAWTLIAPPIRAMHTTDGSFHVRGRFDIEHGEHAVARLIARILDLPRQGASVDTRLAVTAGAAGEQWLRTFDGRRLETRQFTPDGCELVERFRVLEVRFLLQSSGESLDYVQRSSAIAIGHVRVPLPKVCAPHVDAREDPAGPGAIRVHVRVTLPAIGTLIVYQGLIELEAVPS